MPRDSRLVTAFGAHAFGSWHREQSFIVTSDGAERAEIAGRRPLGDRREINPSDVLANLTLNLSRQHEKESAVSMLERAANVRRGTIRAVQAPLRPMDASLRLVSRRRACRSAVSAGESTALWKAGCQIWPSDRGGRASISLRLARAGSVFAEHLAALAGRNGPCVEMSESIGTMWASPTSDQAQGKAHRDGRSR
jgi:hypothetical protein